MFIILLDFKDVEFKDEDKVLLLLWVSLNC